MSARILILEDDAELGAQLVAQLSAAGFTPLLQRDPTSLTRGTMPAVELVLLDLMLPNAHGLDLLKQLRLWSEVPVLVLSARRETADRVRALSLGADDYLTKPYWPEELLERVRARLRRPRLAHDGQLVVGALSVDKSARTTAVDGRAIELTRVEQALVEALAERAGAAISRRALVDRTLADRSVSGDRDPSERALDVHVSRLRKKLGPEVAIETVWGIGYRLAKPGAP
jgi:two-component system response regulator MtrA